MAASRVTQSDGQDAPPLQPRSPFGDRHLKQAAQHHQSEIWPKGQSTFHQSAVALARDPRLETQRDALWRPGMLPAPYHSKTGHAVCWPHYRLLFYVEVSLDPMDGWGFGLADRKPENRIRLVTSWIATCRARTSPIFLIRFESGKLFLISDLGDQETCREEISHLPIPSAGLSLVCSPSFDRTCTRTMASSQNSAYFPFQVMWSGRGALTFSRCSLARTTQHPVQL